MTTYGQKGGEGPTRGKKATTYIVTLPDGTTAKKRDFDPPRDPAGYAYQHEGKWHVAAIDEANCQRFSHFTECPAEEVGSDGRTMGARQSFTENGVFLGTD